MFPRGGKEEKKGGGDSPRHTASAVAEKTFVEEKKEEEKGPVKPLSLKEGERREEGGGKRPFFPGKFFPLGRDSWTGRGERKKKSFFSD